MNKIAPDVSKFQKRDIFSRCKVELGSAIIYIHHISTHIHILIWLYDLTLWSIVWFYNICIARGSSFLPTYELHVSLSSRERKRHNIIIALVMIHKYHILRDLRVSYNRTLSFILKTSKNSRMMVEQRAQDIVLDMIVLSFNCSRPKWRLKSPMIEVIWVSLKVRIVYSNPKENSCLNACVLLRYESIIATPDPLLSLALLRD
jgi:hypothetical protein